MPRKRFAPEQRTSKLREAEELLERGKTTEDVCRTLGIIEQSYYLWRKENGGMGAERARQLKHLEKENARIKKPAADLLRDTAILKETVKGNF